MKFKMKLVLTAVFLNILAISLQEECLNCLRPARIYGGLMNTVNESDNILFRCQAYNLTEKTIHMYLFKNGKGVRMSATAGDDAIFKLTKVTTEHSGLYTCLYSDGKFTISETNATGTNSFSLQVLGKILPANITGTETAVKKGETLTLTCTITTMQICTQVYVYLCLNGIGNNKKQVNCSNTTISTTFLLSNFLETSSGNYSCVYSVTNYNLSEVNNTGENTVFINVYGFHVQTVIISGLVAAVVVLLVLLVLLGFCWYRGILSFRVCYDPTVRTPNTEPFYYDITAGTLYMDKNGELRCFGAQSRENAVDVRVENLNPLYSLVENHEEVRPVDQSIELDVERVCYDSVKAPYAAVMKRKDKTGDEQVMQSFSCKNNVLYTVANY